MRKILRAYYIAGMLLALFTVDQGISQNTVIDRHQACKQQDGNLTLVSSITDDPGNQK
jgi:hypothetical protein